MRITKGYFLIILGAILLLSSTFMTALSVTGDPINFHVRVVDQTTGNGVANADVYVFLGSGSTLVSPELADYHQVTDAYGYVYFVIPHGFHRFCVDAEGYTSDWANDLYTYGGASGVTDSITTYVMNVYPGTPFGGDIFQYPEIVFSGLQIVGILAIAVGAIFEVMERRGNKRR